jgi:hypothetical protein
MNDQIPLAGTVRVDSSGRRMPTEASQPEADNPLSRPVTACFEFRAKDQPWVVQIQLLLNPNVSPWVLVGGSIRGDICTDPGNGWKVVNGLLDPQDGSLDIVAQQSPLVDDPAAAEDVVNPVHHGPCHHALLIFVRPLPYLPLAYEGNFFFADQGLHFQPCILLFKGWNACW